MSRPPFDDPQMQRRDEGQLQAVREQLQEVFLQAPTPMVLVTGPEHRFAFANPTFEALVRRPVVGRTIEEALSVEEAAQLVPSIEKVYETGAPQSPPEVAIELRDEAGPPQRLYLAASFTPLKDADGRIRAVAGLMADVTEHVEARRAIEESEARFRQIANALPMIVWTATGDFHVDWYNDWWYRYLGLPRGTRWDDPDTAPMHPDDVVRTRPRLREAVETGSDFLMEQRFRRGSDGEYRWHLVRGVPIRDESGRIVKWIGANADIHDQKTATARLEQERELRERFVATLSHDLRTPLTVARLSADMLPRRADDPAAVERLAARITESLDRSDRMIRDLLDANRLRAGEELPVALVPCELDGVARQALEELSVVHGERFVLRADGTIRGHWDCDGLRRIIENLCTNAVKYGAADRQVIVVLAERGRDEVAIAVHNEGEPIPAEDQRSLFQHHRRLDRAQSGARGWGIGLALVDGLAKAHGGRVELVSTREAGTTFTVILARDARHRLQPA